MPKHNSWIVIKNKQKDETIPSEIRLEKNGKVYIDGQLYQENNSKYKNLNVNVETYNKINLGEDTEKLIASQKDTKKGESKIISKFKDKNKTEQTSVKF